MKVVHVLIDTDNATNGVVVVGGFNPRRCLTTKNLTKEELRYVKSRPYTYFHCYAYTYQLRYVHQTQTTISPHLPLRSLPTTSLNGAKHRNDADT